MRIIRTEKTNQSLTAISKQKREKIVIYWLAFELSDAKETPK